MSVSLGDRNVTRLDEWGPLGRGRCGLGSHTSHPPGLQVAQTTFLLILRARYYHPRPSESDGLDWFPSTCNIMSGLEIAGVLLGTFPLIISGIEHWRNCAKVGGFFWKVRKEYSRCRSDVNFHEILYKRNLKALLIPIVNEAASVDSLVDDPGGKGWKDQALQGKLVERLQESYNVYVEIIQEMNDTAEELRKELCFDDTTVQQKLAPPPDASKSRQPSPRPSRMLVSKSTLDYHIFRAKFSLGENRRDGLFALLKEGNQRLEKLLVSSDTISALQNAPPSAVKQISVLENAFKKAYRKSELLFKALQKSWNCTCLQHHFANLRLEHRSSAEVYFEIILMFIRPSGWDDIPWNWREFQCGGHTESCNAVPRALSNDIQPGLARVKPQSPPPTPPITKSKRVAFSGVTNVAPNIEADIILDPAIHLCNLLGRQSQCTSCMCIISHGGEEYHLHPSNKREPLREDAVLNLSFILSSDFEGSL